MAEYKLIAPVDDSGIYWAGDWGVSSNGPNDATYYKRTAGGPIEVPTRVVRGIGRTPEGIPRDTLQQLQGGFQKVENTASKVGKYGMYAMAAAAGASALGAFGGAGAAAPGATAATTYPLATAPAASALSGTGVASAASQAATAAAAAGGTAAGAGGLGGAGLGGGAAVPAGGANLGGASLGYSPTAAGAPLGGAVKGTSVPWRKIISQTMRQQGETPAQPNTAQGDIARSLGALPQWMPDRMRQIGGETVEQAEARRKRREIADAMVMQIATGGGSPAYG